MAKNKKDSKDQELLFEPIVAKPIPLGIPVIEKYPLKEPFVHAIITEDPVRKTLKYLIDELSLNDEEKKVYSDIINILQMELKVPRSEIDPKEYFEEHAKRTIEKYKLSLGKIANVSWSKILYFAERDMIGYGPINPFMLDPNIEDISIDGVGKPAFVWHRKYESLETNLVFDDDQELDDTIVRLVHLAGKHISTAYPVVDATLPGRHRLAATFRREVSPQGSTLSIRKFREDPITIIDMLNFGTLDYKIASYLWMLMENRSSTIVVGATASGKTTTLNSLLTMIRPNLKIVTIEEVQEINIPHQNWIPLVSRPSYGLGAERIGEVTLYDLVKASLRMRPDVLVVGEVRGEEAFVLFQAISTGHGGMCLPPNEKLLFYEGTNPRLANIGEVVEDVFRHGCVTHSFGLEIAEPSIELRVPSFDMNTNKIVLSNVKKVSKRYYNGNILKITTEAGKVMNVTEDHPLLVVDRGKLTRVPARQLKVGDLLPCPTPLPSEDNKVDYKAELYFLKVKEIEIIPYEGFVYDLYEVEGTHNFVHGTGLISSNCTLHADDVYSATQRLTSKPMDVSPSYIPFLDLVVSTRRVAIPIAESGFLKVARRVIAVDEVIEYGKYVRVFEWAPSNDSFVAYRLEDSYKLKKLARDRGMSMDEVLEELDRRAVILDWLRKRGIRNYKDIGAVFEQYYNNPKGVFKKIGKQIEPIIK